MSDILHGDKESKLQIEMGKDNKKVKNYLSFSPPNAKIDFYSFNLPAGFTCPGAKDCLSKADKLTGKITDGIHNKFRCFAATAEMIFPAVRTQRHSNFEILIALKTESAMASELIKAFYKQVPIKHRAVFRLHVSGDFFNAEYFKAWMAVAVHFPNTLFYAYTKSVNLFAVNKNNLPSNFNIVASNGGNYDNLIESENLRYATVVFSEAEAENYSLSDYWKQILGRNKGLPIDHDDSHAYNSKEPFALLLHGQQKKGTESAKALSLLGGQSGKSSYNRNKKKHAIALTA